MSFEGPMWIYGLRDPAWLLRHKPDDAKRVLFMSFAKKMGGEWRIPQKAVQAYEAKCPEPGS